jgi:hypothetical protein
MSELAVVYLVPSNGAEAPHILLSATAAALETPPRVR